MKIEDSSFTQYLVDHLRPLTEADPILLANYVVALLENNKPKNDWQKLCAEQLVDFLGKGTEEFVLKLFNVIEDGTVSVSLESPPRKDSIALMSPRSSPLGDAMAVEDTNTIIPSRNNADPKASNQVEKGLEKVTNKNSGLHSYQEEGSDDDDDDDDDRNHKHRRRSGRSGSYDKDNQDEGKSFTRKRNRLVGNGQPSHESDGLIRNYKQKNYHFRDEGSQWVDSRGFTPRNKALVAGFQVQNCLSRGILGRGKGAINLWGSHEQRITPFSSSDYNTGSVQMNSSTTLHSGRLVPGRPNPPHLQTWGGYGQLSGIANASVDQMLALNSGMQVSRVPMSTINLGLSLVRPRCPDFEERGYCLMGDLCPMEHGVNRIVVEDVQGLSQFNLPVELLSGHEGLLSASGPPSGASLATGGVTNRSVEEVNISHVIESRGPSNATASNEYNPDEPLCLKEQPYWDRTGSTVSDRIGPVTNNEVKADISLDGALSSLKPPKKSALEESETHGSQKAPEARQEQIRIPSSGKRHYSIQQVDNTVSTFEKGSYHEWKLPSTSECASRTLYVKCIPIENNRKELLLAHFQKFGEITDIRILPHSDRAFVQFQHPKDAKLALVSPDAVMGNRFIRLSWALRDNVQCSEGKTKGNEMGLHQRSLSAEKMNEEANSSTIVVTTPLVTAGKSSTLGVSSDHVASKRKEELEHMKEVLQCKQEELARKRNEFRIRLEHFSKQGKGHVELEQLKGSQTNSVSIEQTAGGTLNLQNVSKQPLPLGKTSFGTMPHVSAKSSLKVSAPVSTVYPTRFKIDNRTTCFRILPPLPDALLDMKALKEYFSTFGEISSMEYENKDDVVSKNSSICLAFNSRHAAENAFVQGRSYKGTLLQIAWVNNISANANSVDPIEKDAAKDNTPEELQHARKVKPDSLPVESSPLNAVQLVDEGTQHPTLASSSPGAVNGIGESPTPVDDANA